MSDQADKADMNDNLARLMLRMRIGRGIRARKKSLAEVEAEAKLVAEAMFRAADKKAGIRSRFNQQKNNEQ